MKRLKSRGFSLTELLVVIAIILVVSGMAVPNISRTIDTARLKSAAQDVASIYHEARIRATQDNAYYEVLVTPAGAGPAQACLDLDGDGFCGPAEPQMQVPGNVVLSNSSVPAGLDSSALGFVPFKTETSTTYTQQGVLVSGLAWNSRGLPCQKVSTGSPCSNWVNSAGGSGPVGWVQYLQLRRGGTNIMYAAVTVSPTGRVRTWTYSPSSSGKNWF